MSWLLARLFYFSKKRVRKTHACATAHTKHRHSARTTHSVRRSRCPTPVYKILFLQFTLFCRQSWTPSFRQLFIKCAHVSFSSRFRSVARTHFELTSVPCILLSRSSSQSRACAMEEASHSQVFENLRTWGFFIAGIFGMLGNALCILVSLHRDMRSPVTRRAGHICFG